MILFGPEICGDLRAAGRREWLETNGLGGFASSTIAGMHTRRYHGLLTAAIKPPVVRLLMLSKLEATLVVDGQRFELGINQYPGVFHPRGERFLRQFRLDPFPIATYEAGGVQLEQTILMVHGENTTMIEYVTRPAGTGPLAGDVRLELRPLVAFRDYHGAIRQNDRLDPHVHAASGLATFHPYQELPALHLAHDSDDLETSGKWLLNFEYAVERERGFDDGDDLYEPFVLHFDLARRLRATVIASTERRAVADAVTLREAEIARRTALRLSAPADELVEILSAAADQYLVQRGPGITDQVAASPPHVLAPGAGDPAGGTTVIAGYHWFGDWGRDTMIALPGLTLTTGRHDAARSILLEFARHVDRGMLPNRFPDGDEPPEYNTVDATLWYFEAIRAFLAHTGDEPFVRDQLYPTLVEIIEWHVRGTRYGIKVDRDGLLLAGEPGVQLTWMDVKIGDWVVTPRHGKPVEIQALWYNALRVLEDLARRFGDTAGQQHYRRMADQARESFDRLFWNAAGGYLYDVIGPDGPDASLRPNQILAVSLAYPLVNGERARTVVDVVEHELLTPYGLRSLAPGDPQYAGRYIGIPRERDSVYHQGTVWGWLIGPFVTAYLKVNGSTPEARSRALYYLDGFRTHLRDAGLGHISEIFDGDPPHEPRGCAAQAWSVAEVLRVLVEETLSPPASV
jgi:predicted glycogen debranching enzyme